MTNAKRAIEMDVSERLDPGSVASLLASTCLTTSISFTENFVKYLTDTYESLVKAAFTKAKAWSLTTALGARVCQEVHKDSGALARSISVTKNVSDRQKLGVSMLWATLRSHKVMDEFSKFEFKDHPAIASEYVKFLATNSGFETVSVDLIYGLPGRQAGALPGRARDAVSPTPPLEVISNLAIHTRSVDDPVWSAGAHSIPARNPPIIISGVSFASQSSR